MEAAARAQNLLLTNQLLLNPMLQYQLLLHSLLMPLLTSNAPGDMTEGQATGQDDSLPFTVLANQLAITQLNHLVMDLIDKDTHSKAKEETTPPEHRTELLQLLTYHKKLLQLLTKGFKAIQTDMTDINTVLTSILSTAAADHDSTEALQLQVLTAVSEGFVNATYDLARLRGDLQDLATTHADQLGECQETVQEAAIHMTRTLTELVKDTTKALKEEMVSIAKEGFTSVQAEVASLRVDVQGVNATNALHSQEAMALAQVTATGLLKLQADVNNLTVVLEDAVATFNFTSASKEDTTNCSDVGKASECPCRFFPVGDECFHVSEEAEVLQWAQARKFCRSVGGDLADPEDILSLILAINKRFGVGVKSLWVGGEEQGVDVMAPFLTRSDVDSDPGAHDPAPWRWLSGVEVTHGWLRGRPLGPAGVNMCLVISGRGLDSVYCGKKLRYVCEYFRQPAEEVEEDYVAEVEEDYDYGEEDYNK